MTDNPFANASAPATAAHPDPVADPISTTKVTDTAKTDPFSDPSGPGSGEKFSDMMGRLLLIKPTEFIKDKDTTQGPADVVIADIAILDDPTDPGHVADRVFIFQAGPLRDSKAVLEGPSPYLLGRLGKVDTKAGNKAYVLAAANDEEKGLARQFLAVKQL